MALRTKTTKWSFETNVASLAASTLYAFPAITVYAETNGRTIRSAILRYSFHVDQAGAANITSRQGGVQIDAVGALDVAVAGTVANTGDHFSLMCQEDVTAYFVANFTGASHSVVARWRQVGGAVINLTCELILTYEYEETGLVTAFKTIEIPLESPVAALSAVLSEVGTNQVPILNDLPEAGKTFLDIYFRIDTNASAPAIGDFQLGLSLDAEAEVLSGGYRQALVTSYWLRYLWKRPTINTGVAHAFNARSTVASRCQWLKVVMVVTYSYDRSTTTRVRNSVQLPVTGRANLLQGPSDTDAVRLQLPFSVHEPATITLQQSGVEFEYVDTTTPSNFLFRVGGQSFRAYTCQAFTDNGGPFPLCQRIDSGGAQGLGHTLVRGDNVLTVDAYTTGTTVFPSCLQGMLYLNYDSNVSPLGEGAHAHTIELAVFDNVATSPTIQNSPSVDVEIPEASYALLNVALDLYVISSTARGQDVAVETSGGYRVGASFFVRGAEVNMYRVFADFTSLFRKTSNHPVVLEDIETARVYRSVNIGSTQHWPCANLVVTYHALARTVAGVVSDYAGDGSGLVVGVHRVDTGELIATATTAVGGAYSVSVLENVAELFAQVQEDATHCGRSANGVAV